MLEVGHEFNEEGIAVGAEPGRYGMTRLTMVHRMATEKQNDSVYVHSRACIYTAHEATIGYDSGDASVVVGSAMNRQTDAATYARVNWRRTAS